MKSSKLKIVICIVWAIGVIGLVLFQKSQIVNAENSEIESAIPMPDLKEVEKFNALILKRFLEETGFGMRRITPPNLHLENFAAKNDSEKESINYFEEKGWKVGLFLYGLQAFKSKSKHLNSYYHANEPVVVTKNVKIDELPFADEILANVAKAFTKFQSNKETDETPFEFSSNDWWYLAKPVRAVNESCVKCHQNYVAVKQKDSDIITFRPRQIGDVNGILVYSFQKVKK